MMAYDPEMARIERQDAQQAILAERAYWQQRYPEPARTPEERLLDALSSAQFYAARWPADSPRGQWARRDMARALRRLTGTPV